MKIPALFLLAMLFLTNIARSQDIITKKNGEKINAKVLKVNPENIEYKLQDPSGQSMIMSVSEITGIQYENGSKDTFDASHKNGMNTNSGGIYTLAQRGTLDAQMYYRGGKRAFVAGALSALYPGYGLIPVAVIASTRPRYESLNFPYPELMDKPEYSDAYTRKAFKIKKGKVWEGFGIVTASILTVIAAVTVASMSYH